MSETAFEKSLPGLRIAGKYVVERIIGRGGMGCVALGHHEDLGQKVAIKFMLEHGASDEGLVTRFMREAQLAAKLQSEHVVRVFDVGRLESGLPYMVMEYLEGMSLSDALQEKGRLPLVVVVDYVLQALEAIAEAHAMGIVHRDLKPENMFLAKKMGTSRTVKVLDFGISKAASGEENRSLTQSATMLGSPLYMSPEQIRAAKDVDVRSDIWSIGVVLYQLVEGRPPFDGETIGAVFGQIQYEDAKPMEHAPPAFDAAVRKCLARAPDGRYPTVRHLADALEPFASTTSEKSLQVIHQVLAPNAATERPPPNVDTGNVTGASPPAHAATPTNRTFDGAATSAEAPQSKRRGPPTMAIVAVLALAAGAGGIAFVLSRGSSAQHPVGLVPAASAEPAPSAAAPTPRAAEPSARPEPAAPAETSSTPSPARSAPAASVRAPSPTAAPRPVASTPKPTAPTAPAGKPAAEPDRGF